MSKIIVSYRRSDSAAIAGRIFDRLALHYGKESVFMDIDNIPFGKDFRKHIHQMLSESDILIEVVGPKWLGSSRRGITRIKNEADPVRIEIELALQKGIPVIPVLVNGANMPKADDLPDSLENFIYLNAAPVDVGRDFHQHIDRLIRSMDQVLQSSQSTTAKIIAPATVRSKDEQSRVSDSIGKHSITTATFLGAAMVLLLVLAHVIFFSLFDTKIAYHRSASILISFMFGAVLFSLLKVNLKHAAVFGAIVSLVAIILMIAVTVGINHVPMLPRDSYEWIAVTEYAASIMLATIAGNATAQSSHSLWHGKMAPKITLTSAAIASATLLGSIYLGLHNSLI
jgi:hypothetical protein